MNTPGSLDTTILLSCSSFLRRWRNHEFLDVIEHTSITKLLRCSLFRRKGEPWIPPDRCAYNDIVVLFIVSNALENISRSSNIEQYYMCVHHFWGSGGILTTSTSLSISCYYSILSVLSFLEHWRSHECFETIALVKIWLCLNHF